MIIQYCFALITVLQRDFHVAWLVRKHFIWRFLLFRMLQLKSVTFSMNVMQTLTKMIKKFWILVTVRILLMRPQRSKFILLSC